jgi:hypothetical protein
MIENIQNQIHCKVSHNGELRRFFFTGTEFTSLYNQVKSIMGLNDKEFVLKYKDDEGDMITLSTNEELAFAISCMVPPSTFRLDVVLLEKEIPELSPGCTKRRGRGCRGGRGGWEDRGDKKRGRWEKKMEKHEMRKSCKKEKLENKRQKIAECIQRLSNIPPNEGKYEWRQKKVQHLQQKLEWIESLIAGKDDDNGSGHPHKKPKCEVVPLSPEQKALIDEAKTKIKNQKEIVYQIQTEIRNRKSLWPETPDEKKDELARSLMELKQQKIAARLVLCDLKKEICQLYHQQ